MVQRFKSPLTMQQLRNQIAEEIQRARDNGATLEDIRAIIKRGNERLREMSSKRPPFDPTTGPFTPGTPISPAFITPQEDLRPDLKDKPRHFLEDLVDENPILANFGGGGGRIPGGGGGRIPGGGGLFGPITRSGSNGSFQQDLISEIFGQRPELAFLGHLGESGLGRNQQRALRGQASNFLGRFQQAAGQQLARGNLPTLMPGDFFKNLNFQNEFFRLAPNQRGQQPSQFGPRTRFQF